MPLKEVRQSPRVLKARDALARQAATNLRQRQNTTAKIANSGLVNYRTTVPLTDAERARRHTALASSR